MPVTGPSNIDWIELDDSGPLAEWCEFPDEGVSPLRGLQLRNSDVEIGGRRGVFPIPREVDALTVTLLGNLYGHRDLDGNSVSGEYAVNRQLDTNRDFLVANVYNPPDTADGTRTLTLHRVGGNVFSGRVIVDGRLGLVGVAPVLQTFTLTIVCVDGGLDPEGS